MLSQITLRFNSNQLEESYFKSSTPLLTKEFQNWMIYVIIYSLPQLILFIINQYMIYAILAVFVMIISIALNFFLKFKPNAINIVLLICQLGCAAVFNSTYYVTQTNKPDASFAFYYGFQCAFFHFILYLQGTHFVSQTVVLAGVLIWYLVYNNNQSLVQFLNNFTFFQVFFGLVLIRYTLEKQRRDSFIQQLEQKKWYTVIEEVITQWIVVADYDNRQDQIMIKRCNRYFKNRFKIFDHKDFRRLMREIFVRQVIISDSQIGKNNKKIIKIDDFESTLETQIRNHLIYNDKMNSSENQSEKAQPFKEYIGYFHHKKYNRLNIKLLNFFQNEKWMTLISINENQYFKTAKFVKSEIKKREQLLKLVLTKSLTSYSHILQFFKNALLKQTLRKKTRNIFEKMINEGYLAFNTQLSIFELLKSKYPNQFKFSSIQTSLIIRDISLVFARNFEISAKIQNITLIYSDQQKLMLILYSLLECMTIEKQKEKQKKKLQIVFSHKIQTQVKIKIKFGENYFIDEIKELMSKSWAISQNQQNFKFLLNFQKIMIQYFKEQNSFSNSKQQQICINICVAQYLLTQIGPYNKFIFNWKKNQVSLFIYKDLKKQMENIFSVASLRESLLLSEKSEACFNNNQNELFQSEEGNFFQDSKYKFKNFPNKFNKN